MQMNTETFQNESPPQETKNLSFWFTLVKYS